MNDQVIHIVGYENIWKLYQLLTHRNRKCFGPAPHNMEHCASEAHKPHAGTSVACNHAKHGALNTKPHPECNVKQTRSCLFFQANKISVFGTNLA